MGAAGRQLLRARGAASRGAGGFTILELLLVLVLLGVLATLALPSWFERPEITLRNATQLLAQDLRSAQNRAAYLRREMHVVFPADGLGYRVVTSDGEPQPHPTGGPRFERDYGRDAVFEGVRVVDADFGGERTLVYDAGGNARDGGRVVLEFLDEREVVEVERGRGFLSVEGAREIWPQAPTSR